MAYVECYFRYLERNEIGDQGCLHLSKAYWPNLKSIGASKEIIEYLDRNEIGDQGCIYLSKAHWPNLGTIFLSKIY